jgi:signal transduction histidine kinase
MYTEMLAGGLVPAAERESYLATLHAEAERLGHLVENVLAYSRLERRSQGARLETAEIGALLAGMAGRLRARAERDGFLVTIPERAKGTVEADPAAVERILLNWVDNGCKYAAGAADRRLEIEVLPCPPRGRFLALRLRDHGPGIPRAVRRRLFCPFHKSAARAAASAPGVGLGLSLSRRLARSLGGDLRLAEAGEGGAVFELLLLSPRS